MGFGFGVDFVVNGKIKDRLKKDFPGKFTDKELSLAADAFCKAGDSKDLDALKDENTQKAKAIEIFKRVIPKTDAEKLLANKINEGYGVA